MVPGHRPDRVHRELFISEKETEAGMKYLIIIILILNTTGPFRSNGNRYIAEGNDAYKLQQFGKAAESYRSPPRESRQYHAHIQSWKCPV